MGQICGNTDFFQQLLDKYGEIFIKLVCSQKAKQTLQQKFKEVITKLRQFVSNFINKISTLIDQKIKDLTQNFERLKTKMNNLIPEGIAYLEKKNGKSIDEFSGFTNFIKKIDSIRDDTLQQIKTHQITVENQLLQKKTQIYNEIEQQRPKVPLYENLSQNMRIKILNKAQKQFKEQIEQSNQKIGEKANQKFDSSFDQIDEYLNKLNPITMINDFVEKSAKQMTKNVTGSGVGNKINGFIDKVF